ncbi:L domain-like protein [Rhizoclosmatium globosum]|uniref:L domain-like protein n=1 Tax=Rhizoclosmatium globosum TaxID=329046 RepID=A0A1Y2CNP1_9FUNG|nr:L domain-like protein [Rhizoclosmatium globosum]|eukprot:ORY48464.1 L domain-like protein [Rhizoclosmatium globosum]
MKWTHPIFLVALFGTATAAANDCQVAKAAWPQFFGSIDPVSCCTQYGDYGSVSGINCLSGATSVDTMCGASCRNGSITDIMVYYYGADKTRSPTAGPFPDLSGLTQVTLLSLSTNLIGMATNWPPALQELYLNDATLTGAFPSFNKTTALQRISIDNSNLSGRLPTLPNTLTYVGLSSNSLITDVSNLPSSLTALTLQASGSGRMPSLKSLTRLKELRISDCNFSGDFPLLPDSLTLMEVSGTNFTGPFPALPKSLQSVILDDTPLTGSFPTLPNSIAGVIINNVPLSGSIPAWDSSALYSVQLSGTKLSGSIPILPSSIESLILEDSMFTGSLPPLPQGLRQLVVRNNQLTGLIPSLPTSLTELDLKNNHLNGTIPTLPSLLYLDLSNNQLTGTIPSSIKKTGSFIKVPQVPVTPSQLPGSIPVGSGSQIPVPVPGGSSPGSISPGPGPVPIPIPSPVPVPTTPEYAYFIQLDGNCFTNAAALNVTNVCPSADIIASGTAISALSDVEYVDKAKAYKLTTVPDCLNPCRNKIPGYSTFDSNTAALNVTCLEVDTNPNSLQPFLDCSSTIPKCDDGLVFGTGSQRAAVFVQLLNNLCKQYVQPSPVVSVSNRTVSFSFNHQDTTLFGFQAFVSTVNGTFVAGSKFDISKPLKVPASASKKRDSLETQTISLPCDMKAAVLHTKYVVDDPSILISDLDKLGHFKQVDLDLTASGSGCQGDAVPIVTTAAASPIKTAIVPIATTAIVIPPPTTTENIAPQVVTTAAFIPPMTTTIPAPIVNPANEGSGAVNNAGNNGGSSGNMGRE